MSENMNWSFAGLWNESLERNKERELKARDVIWASELGGALIDRYLKMKAIKPTNPPNPRSLRKFEAGNIWEAIIGYVLTRAGLLKTKQDWLSYQYDGLLKVTGKLDFIAGGMPDYEKATKTIQSEFNWLPPFISEATINIVTKLKEQFPEGLKDIILEIKSCSSFMFEKFEKTEKAQPQHNLQTFHYLKAGDMPEAHIVYVSKDDARLIEFGVYNPSLVEQDYKKDIETMTNYVKTNTEPPKEKPIGFDDKFYANWKIGYSQYLTRLYDLKDQKEFDDKYKPIAERWNRVIERIKDKKELTANNQEAIKEMKEYGFDIDNLMENITKEVTNGEPK